MKMIPQAIISKPRCRSAGRIAWRMPKPSSRKAAIIVMPRAAAPKLSKTDLSPLLNPVRSMLPHMPNVQQQQARLEEAFDKIEETILPCIAMMLETLLDASANLSELDPKVLIAELQTLAAELEELTRAVERNSPAHLDAGEYRVANG